MSAIHGLGGSNEHPELGQKKKKKKKYIYIYIYIKFFLFDPPKINFEPPRPKF